MKRKQLKPFFSSAIDFNDKPLSHKFDDFEIFPVKRDIDEDEGQDEDDHSITRCEPEEAEAWAIYTSVKDNSGDWVADLPTKELAGLFVQLLETIIAGRMPDESKGGWVVEDVITGAKKIEEEITDEDARDIFDALDFDAGLGMNWERIYDAIREHVRDRD